MTDITGVDTLATGSGAGAGATGVESSGASWPSGAAGTVDGEAAGPAAGAEDTFGDPSEPHAETAKASTITAAPPRTITLPVSRLRVTRFSLPRNGRG